MNAVVLGQGRQLSGVRAGGPLPRLTACAASKTAGVRFVESLAGWGDR